MLGAGLAQRVDQFTGTSSTQLSHPRIPSPPAVNESLKYEHLYRIEISNGQDLVDETETCRDVYNRIRPAKRLAGILRSRHTSRSRPNTGRFVQSS